MSEITLPITLAAQGITVTKGVAAALPRRQVGDQFQATVLFNRNGNTQLQLPQGTMSARTDLPLRAGEQLKLTVAQLQPQVTLSISKSASAPLDALSQKTYPRQQPLQQSIQNLGQLMQSQTTGKGSQVAIQQLLQQLPTIVQLFNPTNIKNQISKSGSFMENNLLNNRGAELKGDLKMQLLQLKAKLMNQPAEQKALRQVDAMIARIELSQLKTLQSSSGNTPSTSQGATEQGAKEPTQRSWQVEIPFMVDDTPQQIALKFRQQQESEESEKMRWHIELNLSPPDLGELEVHAIYHQEKLDIHFMTEKPETSRLISEQLETLESSLSVAGISTGTLFSRQKSVNDPPSAPTHSAGFSIKA